MVFCFWVSSFFFGVERERERESEKRRSKERRRRSKVVGGCDRRRAMIGSKKEKEKKKTHVGAVDDGADGETQRHAELVSGGTTATALGLYLCAWSGERKREEKDRKR